jgi:hypothetical protein
MVPRIPPSLSTPTGAPMSPGGALTFAVAFVGNLLESWGPI